MRRSALLNYCICIVAAILLTGMSAPPPRPLETNKAVVRAYIEKIAAPELGAPWSDLLCDGFTLNGGELTPDRMTEMSESFLPGLSDLRTEVELQVAEGDWVASRIVFTARHSGAFNGLAATNKIVKFYGFVFDRLENGKVCEMRHEIDMHGLLRQLRSDQ